MMKISKLQYITQSETAEEIRAEVHAVVNNGIDWVQLRMKDDNLDHESIAKDVKLICANKATFIINDRVELAKKVDADGVHLGLNDMSIEQARSILGPDKIIGGTANTMVDCKNAELSGTDYIGMGPFGFTDTKEELAPIIGLEGFQKLFPKDEKYGWMFMSLNLPIVAVGGIKIEDVSGLMNSRLHGIAVSGMIANADNQTILIHELKETIYGYVENS
jgi:thiamine-phosphate pyrophosphorylase